MSPVSEDDFLLEPDYHFRFGGDIIDNPLGKTQLKLAIFDPHGPKFN